MIKTFVGAALALALAGSVSARPSNAAVLIVPHIAAVPEPASWALMLTGMFGIGVALRRRSHALG